MTCTRIDSWSDFELELLYEHINDEDYYEQLRPHIFRTESAIRGKMGKVRREAGIEATRRGPRAEGERLENARKAAAASRQLAAALAALDEISAPALSEHDRRESDGLRRAHDDIAAAGLSEHDRAEADTLQRVHAEVADEPHQELQLAFPLNGPLFDWRAPVGQDGRATEGRWAA